MRLDPHRKPRWFRAYSFVLATTMLFLLLWAGQFIAQLVVVSHEAVAAGQPFDWSLFWPRFLAATLQNWQAEFLQLIWQTIGLGIFYHWGSVQSRESNERLERKLDELLRRIPDRHLRRDIREQISDYQQK